jgi:hypothetical protein
MTTNTTLKSKYHFGIERIGNSNKYRLIRLSKTGNSVLWNAVFSNKDLSIHILGPLEAANDHTAYVFALNDSSPTIRRTVILQTSSLMKPFGLGYEKDDNDAYLFKVSTENVFEVYVADTVGKDEGILVQMFTDGSLDHEIDLLNQKAA